MDITYRETRLTRAGVNEYTGVERCNEMVEWTTGVEYWTGVIGVRHPNAHMPRPWYDVTP